MGSDALVGWVTERLRQGWTPQEISGRLGAEFPTKPWMRVGERKRPNSAGLIPMFVA